MYTILEHFRSALCNLKKENKVAMVVSNDALSALDWFRIDTTAEGPGKTGYPYRHLLAFSFFAFTRPRVI